MPRQLRYNTSMKITSRQNEKVKNLLKLKMKKYRDKTGKMLIEGFYPITFAYHNNYPMDELYACPVLFRDKFENEPLIEKCKQRGTTIIEVTENVFKKFSNYESPEGLLAVAAQRHNLLSNYTPSKKGFYIIIESIEKLGNLGAIFRLADNAGATGIIVCDARADIFNPEVIRTSVGTFFSINIWESSTQETISWCKENNIKILATTPSATENYTKMDMTEPLAIIMGAEYAGLSSKWLENADFPIKIPMFGQANSLSVSASTAIVAYEVVRQRIGS